MTEECAQEQRSDRARLSEVTLDEGTTERSSADIEHERAVAIFDLIANNHFEPPGSTRKAVPTTSIWP